MAVRALLDYALEVPDPTVGERFYRSFGLVDGPSAPDAIALRPGGLGRETVRLYGGPRKRLRYLTFGAPEDEMAATGESLRRAGVREVEPPRGAPAGGLWLRD
ncbi:MAG TPA: dioxygenase, partial [Methylomirabilota bacterium]|nr:dioxygenase [Methylomirabilota bacterium]